MISDFFRVSKKFSYSLEIMNETYEQNVFINCPFDELYFPLFQAMVFTVDDCGFTSRCAMEKTDSSQIRILKIYDLIGECKYGIHDLSRTQLDESSSLPRFNMPLELGIFLGAKFLGENEQKQKKCLVFDETPYRYQIYLSDIAGQDIRSHNNEPRILVNKVRDWLASFSLSQLPSGTVIFSRYERFQKELKSFCRQAKHIQEELTYLDYINHVKRFVSNKSDVLHTGLKMRWGKEPPEPSLPHIREAIEAFKGGPNSFAILARSEFTYMQCQSGNNIGYSLEYQEGSLEEHYKCKNDLTEEDVIEILQAYRNEDESWKTKFHWEKQPFS
jgi:hypothetical protein